MLSGLYIFLRHIYIARIKNTSASQYIVLLTCTGTNAELVLKHVTYYSTTFELRVIFVTSCICCTSYELHLLLELRVTFAFKLQATVYCMSYELLLLHKLRLCVHTSFELVLIARITSNLLYKSCKLLYIAQVMSYFLHASYDLLFISGVTSDF